MNPSLSNIKGLLLDLNGVFYIANQLLPGAVETTRQLKARGIPYRFATNNTTESIATMSRNLQTLGLEVPPDTIITASYAAVLYLRQKQYSRIYPLMTDDARTDFQEFTFDDMEADAVVIGDMENNWNYRTLNRAFKLIRQGAEPVALHKSKFWQWEAGLQLDIGAFVVGLEYATDTPATIVGKPSASFFELALQELNLPAEEVIMVGDDIDADVAGAQSAGLRGALVKTGKYRESNVASGISPDATLDSIDQVLSWLS
jgi:HAD superfamily hydrolase (TIGR01458 family)